jgi:hypothetical protein
MKLILIFLILGLVSGCNNPYSIRMSSDYFPLEVGNKWIFQVEGQPQSQSVIEVISFDTVYLVREEGSEIFMEHKEGEVNIIEELFTTHLGDIVTFGKVRETYLRLPFIENDNWEIKFSLSTVYIGDTIHKNLHIVVDSIYITSLSVPSGNYDEVYHLRRMKIEDEDSVISYEWYAPDVGLIRREIPAHSIIWELEDFTFNE